MRLADNPYEFLQDCQRRFGDLFTLRLPGMPVLHVCADPDTVKWLTSASYDQSQRFGGGAEYFLSEGALVCLQGDEHRRQRRLMNPVFTGERLRDYGPIMHEITDAVLSTWTARGQVTLQDEVQDLTLRLIIRCVFGVESGARSERLRTLLLAYLRAMFQPWMFALNMVLGSQRLRRLIRSAGHLQDDLPKPLQVLWQRAPLPAAAHLQDQIYELLDEEIARCLSSQRQDRDEPAREDILAMLLAARDESGAGLSTAEVRAQLLTLLVGGHETTATSLCWALYCLMQNPSALQSLRSELQAAPVGASRLRDMPYLGAVLRESMRLFPIAPFVSRKLRQPLRVGGHVLPIFAHANPCIYLTQRDPRQWQDPLRFRPERMLERHPPVHHYFPFGSGPWRCIGAAFAEEEMRVVLSQIVSRFELSLLPQSDARPYLRWLTVAPRSGLPVSVRPRAPEPRS